MVQRSRFWDGTTIGDATVAPYDAGTEFSEVMTAVAGLASDPNKGGVLSGITGSMFAPGTFRLGPFEALVYGAWYQNDANIDFAIPTPAASTRIDTVVLRKDWAAQTVRVVIINGTEGGSAPPLVQTPGVTWDVPIATLSTTTGGVTTITGNSQRADFWYRTSSAPSIIKTDNNILAVGAQAPSPIAWHEARSAIQLGRSASIAGDNNLSGLWLSDNWYIHATVQDVALVNGPSTRLLLPGNGAFIVQNAPTPAVGSGGALVYKNRMYIEPNGTMTLSPDANARGYIVGDILGGGQPAQARYISMNMYAKSGTTNSAETCIELCAPNPNSMGIDFHVPNVAKWGGLYMNGAGNVFFGRDIGWGRPVGYLDCSSLNFGFGRIRESAATPFIDGQNGGYLMLGAGHNGGYAISVAPGGGHNTSHLGWGDRGWALVHSVGGLVQDSLESEKQEFTYLDPAECAEAVMNTDWLAFEYKPPADYEPPIRPETMEDDDWEKFQAEHAVMQEEAAMARRQRGYALGSQTFRVHPLFGMADRKTAGTQSDLATLACALQSALRRIDEQQAQLDALSGKVN